MHPYALTSRYHTQNLVSPHQTLLVPSLISTMEQEEIRISETEGSLDEDDAPDNLDNEDAIRNPGTFATTEEYLDMSVKLFFNYHLILFYPRSSETCIS